MYFKHWIFSSRYFSVFTVIFDQFNASLLNKCINFFQNNNKNTLTSRNSTVVYRLHKYLKVITLKVYILVILIYIFIPQYFN